MKTLLLTLAIILIPITVSTKGITIWVPGEVITVEPNRVFLRIQCWSGRKNYYIVLPFKPSNIPGLEIECVITPKGKKGKCRCIQDPKYRIKDFERLIRRRR